MTLRAAICKYLREDTDLIEVHAGKVYAEQAPTSAPNPCVVVRRISDIPMQCFAGPVGTREARIQVDAYGDNTDEADALGDLLETKLDGLRGLINTVYIKSCSMQDDAGGRVNPVDSSEQGEVSSSIDLKIFYDR